MQGVTASVTIVADEALQSLTVSGNGCVSISSPTLSTGTTSTYTATITFDGGDGEYSCYIVGTDTAGNTSTSTKSVGTLTLDGNAPTLDNVTINSGADNTTNYTLTIDLNGVTDNKTLTGLSGYYITDGTASAPAYNATGWVNLFPHTNGANVTGISYTLTNDLDDNETKNVYVYLKDRANNVSSAKTDSIFLLADQNPPTLSAATIQDIGSGTNNASMTDNKTVRSTSLQLTTRPLLALHQPA